MTLTGEQISALDRHIQEFQAANYQVREKIVNCFICSFQGNLSNNDFDALGTQTVYVPFLTLGYSQMFPGYSPVPLCKNQTGSKKICSSNQQSDGQRKVRIPFTYWGPALKEKCVSSQEIVLTDEHISMLERCTAKFKHTDTDRQEKIVKQAADNIEKTWQEDTEFNREATINVHELSRTESATSCVMDCLPLT